MHSLPEPFVSRMQALLGEESPAFFSALAAPAPVSIRLNPAKPAKLSFGGDPVEWCETGLLLAARPSFTHDPLFQAGCYYVQEASSMFIASAYRQVFVERAPYRVLDLCAAPGGKSTHLRSLLPPGSLLVSNELVPSRNQVLVQNLVKWGDPGIVVTQSDPARFEALHDHFDLIVVDAPCSGEGLFRKDPAAVDEWSEAAVAACTQRQSGILDSAWKALAPGGVLIYSTCTYESDENEAQVSRLLTGGGELIALDAPAPVERTAYGLRFYPHRVKGEGFFCAAVRKPAVAPAAHRSGKRPVLSTVRVPEASGYLIDPDRWAYFLAGPHLHAIDLGFADELALLAREVNVRYAGLRIGEYSGEQLLPAPELAFSLALSPRIGRIEVTEAQALQFLRGEALRFSETAAGWYLITFGTYGLGWVKVVGDGRANNHFPKGWRIRT